MALRMCIDTSEHATARPSYTSSTPSLRYTHDPYSFAMYCTVDLRGSPVTAEPPKSPTSSSSDSAKKSPACIKYENTMVIAEINKDVQFCAAKIQLKDATGALTAPCGHDLKRKVRLRHKGGITYYACGVCQQKFREVALVKLRPDQVAFLRSGGAPSYYKMGVTPMEPCDPPADVQQADPPAAPTAATCDQLSANDDAGPQ